MAVVDIVKYDGPTDVYAWKHPSQELGNWTQLIVNESQEAIIFKGGQALDLFRAGRHTLSTANIPLLNKLINLPFGGNSPFIAEVWYINKLHSLDIKWGTIDPIQLQDPQYKIFIPVRSYGQFGVQIEDSRKFLIKLVGTLPLFNKDQLTQYFRGVLITRIKDIISTYLVKHKISILHINSYLDEISEEAKDRIAPVFADFGITISNFYVNSVNVPEEDSAVQKLKAALAKRAEMDIVGFNYQQERSFDTLITAAGNEGSGSGVMGAGMGLGMGVAMGGVMGNSFGNISQNVQVNDQIKCQKCGILVSKTANHCSNCGLSFTVPKQRNVICHKCRQEALPDTKFCPNCGYKFNICPECNADNSEAAVNCVNCTKPLPYNCKKCGCLIQANVKFCPNCGLKLTEQCPRYNFEPKSVVKFCPECGERMGGDIE